MRKVVTGRPPSEGGGAGVEGGPLWHQVLQEKRSHWENPEKAAAALAVGIGGERGNELPLGKNCPPTESRDNQ